jgi:hypothetical protein
MADYTQTITNTMQVMGVSPGSLWNVAVWGTDVWGVDEDVWTDTDHQITESMTLTDSLFKDVELTIDFGTITLSDVLNPLQLDVDPVWREVWIGPTDEAEDRSITVWTDV